MKKNLVFVFRAPLHGNIKAQEFLDMLMMAAAFDQKVNVIFIEDGAYALLKNQLSEAIDNKSVSAVMQALAVYEVKDIYIDAYSMEQRAISADQLLLPAELLSREKISQKISTADHVFSF